MSLYKRVCFPLLLSAVVLVGCAKKEAPVPSKVYPVDANLLKEHSDNIHNQLKDTFEEEAIPLSGFFSPLTGKPLEESAITNRPMVVQIDNFASARPQAGLSQADILYEFLAEGNITRYMAVFQSEYPEVVGPIRSTRPYFVDKALEYNPLYVHVGGSMEGLAKVKQLKLADIDALSSNAFYRVSHKKMPHNTYSGKDLILKDASGRGYALETPVTFLTFNKTFTPLIGEKAQSIQFVYRKPSKNDAIGYSSSYKYNSEENRYYRYTNNTPHLDENDDVPITCTNLLVQNVGTRIIDSYGRLAMDFIGSGEGRYYTGGKYVDVTWKKEDVQSVTKFYTTSGELLSLNPGQTWIQILPIGNNEIIE